MGLHVYNNSCEVSPLKFSRGKYTHYIVGLLTKKFTQNCINKYTIRCLTPKIFQKLSLDLDKLLCSYSKTLIE